MNVLGIMERCNYLQSPKRVIAYVQEALDVIQSKDGDSTTRAFIDIEADTRYYNIPSGLRIDGVFRKYDGTRWVRMPRIQHNDMLQDSSASSATQDDDIIMI